MKYQRVMHKGEPIALWYVTDEFAGKINMLAVEMMIQLWKGHSNG